MAIKRRNYYVYAHADVDTKDVFYIGKGVKRRRFETRGRSKEWFKRADKGFRISILDRFVTEEEAHAYERKVILEIGIDNLVNKIMPPATFKRRKRRKKRKYTKKN